MQSAGRVEKEPNGAFANLENCSPCSQIGKSYRRVRVLPGRHKLKINPSGIRGFLLRSERYQGRFTIFSPGFLHKF
jgi:hypothetical protein